MRRSIEVAISKAFFGKVFTKPIAYLVFVSVILGLYLIPPIVALGRQHLNRWIIGALNLVLGGTRIVWLGCLVWACGAVNKAKTVEGSDWGESGLDVFANDIQKVELVGTLSGSPSSAHDQLERLKRLLDDKAINQKEFEQLKAKLLVDARNQS